MTSIRLSAPPLHSSDFCVFLWVLGSINPSFKYEYCTNIITSGHMTQEMLLRVEEKTKAPQLANTPKTVCYLLGRTFQNVTTWVIRTCDACFSTWSARCTFGEALDSQTLTTLLASPGRATLGIDALLDTVPVWFRDAKFVEQVTCGEEKCNHIIHFNDFKIFPPNDPELSQEPHGTTDI